MDQTFDGHFISRNCDVNWLSRGYNLTIKRSVMPTNQRQHSWCHCQDTNPYTRKSAWKLVRSNEVLWSQSRQPDEYLISKRKNCTSQQKSKFDKIQNCFCFIVLLISNFSMTHRYIIIAQAILNFESHMSFFTRISSFSCQHKSITDEVNKLFIALQ